MKIKAQTEKKDSCCFDKDREEGDLSPAPADRSALDRKRYNPTILISTEFFRAPRKFLKEKQ